MLLPSLLQGVYNFGLLVQDSFSIKNFPFPFICTFLTFIFCVKGDKMKEQEHHLLDEPQRKLAKTYETMKALGYSQQMVEPILKNFLDLYDQNWELIEDEQYRVLLDAILENEEHKVGFFSIFQKIFPSI